MLHSQIENVIADYLPVLKRMPPQLSNDLIEGISKMQAYGVESFSSRLIYPSGYSSTFCTSISWANIEKTDQFKEEFINHASPELTKLYKNKSNIISRSADKLNTNFLKIMENAGLNNSIIITAFFPDYIEITYFTANPDKPEDRDLIINNLHSLNLIRKIIDVPLQNIYLSKEFKNKQELLLNKEARNVIWNQSYNRIKPTNLSISNKFSSLTHRELECLIFLRFGSSNSFMADKMGVSIKTIKHHISNLKSKLTLSSRNELIATAKTPEIANISKILKIEDAL